MLWSRGYIIDFFRVSLCVLGKSEGEFLYEKSGDNSLIDKIKVWGAKKSSLVFGGWMFE
jgi:hypothetical protein